MALNVDDSISGISSADDGLRKDAQDSLLKHIKTQSGMQALLADGFQIFEELIEGGERGVVATCMSRMCRYLVTKTLDDWGLQSLKSYLPKFDRGSKEDKELILQAVRFFAVACHENALKVEKSGWVSKALSCRKQYYRPAMVLLEALETLPSLPALIRGAPHGEVMLQHVISEGEEREQLAGLRVASMVVSQLEQVPPDAATDWLRKLRNTHIIRAVVNCIKDAKNGASVESGLGLLAQLSKRQMFLKGLRKEDVVSDLGGHIVGQWRFGTSLSVLLHRILTSEEAANAFTAAGGCERCIQVLATAKLEDVVSRDIVSVLSLWLACATGVEAANAFTTAGGLSTCLGLLDRPDPDVKGILALLKAWSDKSTNSRLAFGQRPDLSRLLGLLSVQVMAIANPARVLVSWALHHESRGSLDLAHSLKDEAINALLPFLAESPMDARYAVGAIHGLVKAIVVDIESANTFAGVGVLDRLLMALGDDSPVETFGAGVRCLLDLAPLRTDAVESKWKEAICLLIARLTEQEVIWEGYDMNALICRLLKMIIFGAEEVEEAMDVNAMELAVTVLTVSKTWAPPSQWQAFLLLHGIFAAEPALLADLNATSKEECIELAVNLVKVPFAASLALTFIATFLSEASMSLGQTFIRARGPQYLIRNVNLDREIRDYALSAVLSIARNTNLTDVVADLERHADTDVADLCEKTPPYNAANAEKLQGEFIAAFDRAPQWPSAEGNIQESAS